MSYKPIVLKPGKEKSLLRFHPWVFSGAILKNDARAVEGDFVEVLSSNGIFLGRGYFSEGSIAVRMLTFEKEALNDQFWIRKLRGALDFRHTLGLVNNAKTQMFRLVHGEGDGLPGLICDIYGRTAVLQCHTEGMYRHRERIVQALLETWPDALDAIYDKSRDTLNRSRDQLSTNDYLWGKASGPVVMKENGHSFWVDWETGQKTGFFIDQRENRQLLAHYAEEKKILNTFCYTGGFSVYALNHGARQVDSLDCSQKAIALCEENVALTLFKDRHHSIVDDAIPYFKTLKKDYDLMVVDPPAFAKHLAAKNSAIKGYRKLNEAAIASIKRGGLIFTFSCSQAIDFQSFTEIIFSAAAQSRRNVRILHRLRQPADHPVNIYHPEGEYLKGLVIAVD